MSSSGRLFGDSDSSRQVDLPVFVTPSELVFSISKRRTILVIYNPYGNDAQFKIMTTNPDRFDVSQTKGIIRPNRRIDITIRLLSSKICELPEPTDELQVIDHFRITIQVSSLRGNRQLKVHWLASADYSDNEDDAGSSSSASKSSKLKRALMKQTGQSGGSIISTSQRGGGPLQLQAISPLRSSTSAGRAAMGGRSPLQADHGPSGSNVNLVCFLGAIVCVILLFLPLAIDSDLCKKSKLYSDSSGSESGRELGSGSSGSQQQSFMARLGDILSVSYEMKFGCSFALGLFTYRLISTMPD